MSNALPFLTFEADRTVLMDGEQRVFNLSVSPSSLARRHWLKGLPSSLQLEHAIDDVEAAIEQCLLAHADRGVLMTAQSVQRLLPELLRPQSEIGRDEVEFEFTRLVAAAHVAGRSDATRALHGESAAALLLLRELMHHLGFQSLRPQG
jgi:hypothetical protein